MYIYVIISLLKLAITFHKSRHVVTYLRDGIKARTEHAVGDSSLINEHISNNTHSAVIRTVIIFKRAHNSDLASVSGDISSSPPVAWGVRLAIIL